MTRLASGDDPTEAGGLAPASTWSEIVTGARIGRYLLLERIGAGGMGVVWRAYDPMLDRRIALKLVAGRGGDPGRLVSEAQALARVQHANIVAIHDVGALPDGLFLAMEFVEGITLTRYLQSPRPWRALVDVFAAIAEAMHAAHAGGVVHGDLKPDNVLVAAHEAGQAMVVKVVDFGLASIVASPRSSRPRDRSSGEHGDSLGSGGSRSDISVRGTPAYLAPEQVAGAPASERSDQYAFFVAMFEALTGARPHAIDSIHAAAVVFRDMRPLRWPGGRAAPRWLRRLVLKGLAYDPAARHADFAEIADALRRGRTRFRRRLGLAVATVAVIAASAGLLREATRCRDAAAEVETVWNDAIGERVDAELRTAFPGAEPGTWRRRRAHFDGVATDLAAASRSACEAEGTLESRQRLRCVDHGLAMLDVAVARLRDGDELAKRFALAGAGLEAIERCDEDANLQQFPPIAETPAARAAVRELEHDIAAATMVDIATSRDSEPLLERLGARAQELGEVGAYTDVLLHRARIASTAEDLGLLRGLLREALASAEASRDDRRIALAWLRLAAANTGPLGDAGVLQVALDRSDAASARLGRPPDIEAQRHRALSRAASVRADYVEALRENDRVRQAGVDAQRADFVVEALIAAVTLNLNADRLEAALTAADDAVEAARSAFGDEHPDVAVAMGARASALLAAARGHGDAAFDRANAAFDESLARLEPWTQVRLGPRRALECNRCVGFTDACRPQAVAACVHCGELSRESSVSSTSLRTMAVAVAALALSDPQAAEAIAREVIARWQEDEQPRTPSQAQTWSAFVLAWAGEREPGLALLRDLGPRGFESTAAVMLDAMLAIQGGDPPSRAAALARLRTNDLAAALRTGELLVRAWMIAELSGESGDREAVAQLAAATSPLCSPGWRRRIDAWLAAPAPAGSALAGSATATDAADHGHAD